MKIPRIGKSAAKSYSYILGLYMGDGCVSRRPENHSYLFRLNVIDKDFAEYAMEHLFKMTGRRTKIFQQNGRFWTFSFGWKDLCDHLESVTEKKGKIPSFVKEWPLELRKKFVEAQMDSDGYVYVDRTRDRYLMGFKNCDEWFDDFVDILHSVGVKTGGIRPEKGRKPGYKDSKMVYVNLPSWAESGCRFNMKRKADKVDAMMKWRRSTTNTLERFLPKTA